MNSKEKVEFLIKEHKEAKNDQHLLVTQHVMDSEAIPSWTDSLNEKSSHDGNLLVEWNLVQDEVRIMNKCELNASKKEVFYDLRDERNHVHNQTKKIDELNDKDDSLWKILLDSQSTCNVIINKEPLTNIRRCEWTSRLQTQTVECCIDHAGEIIGVVLHVIIRKEWRICSTIS